MFARAQRTRVLDVHPRLISRLPVLRRSATLKPSARQLEWLVRRYVLTPLILVGALLCGCRAVPEADEGERVDLARDLMVESAKMAAGASRSDSAERAVRVWRGQGAEGG